MFFRDFRFFHSSLICAQHENPNIIVPLERTPFQKIFFIPLPFCLLCTRQREIPERKITRNTFYRLWDTTRSQVYIFCMWSDDNTMHCVYVPTIVRKRWIGTQDYICGTVFNFICVCVSIKCMLWVCVRKLSTILPFILRICCCFGWKKRCQQRTATS